MLGEIFHPCPSSRAATAPVPSVAMPPAPFAPSKFSGLIERVTAVESRERLPRCIPSPLNDLLLTLASPDRKPSPPTPLSTLERGEHAAHRAVYSQLSTLYSAPILECAILRHRRHIVFACACHRSVRTADRPRPRPFAGWERRRRSMAGRAAPSTRDR